MVTLLCSGIRRVNIVKIFIKSKVTDRVKIIPVKIAMNYFIELENERLKILWN